jgi:hypothetical protein
MDWLLNAFGFISKVRAWLDGKKTYLVSGATILGSSAAVLTITVRWASGEITIGDWWKQCEILFTAIGIAGAQLTQRMATAKAQKTIESEANKCGPAM